MYIKQFNPKDQILPKGITGFAQWDEMPIPIQDKRLFCQLCYAIAHENHTVCLTISNEITGKNFYSAQIQRYEEIFHIIQNVYYPYLAFASSVDSHDIIFIDIPQGLHISDPNIHLLSLTALNQDWHDLVHNLSKAEMDQISYWKPQTVKDIIFHFWD